MDEYNCNKCQLVDTERMVQCDTCDKWFHFECVNVNSEVENVSWNCELCGQQQPLQIMNTSSRNDPTNKTIQQSSLGQPVSSSQSLEGISRSSASSTPVTTPLISATTGGVYAPVTTVSAYYAYNNVGHRSYATTWSNTQLQNNSSSFNPNPLLNATAAISTQNSQADSILKQRELQLQMLEEEKELQRSYLDKKYKILSQIEGVSYCDNNVTTSSYSNQPTPLQLAARQVIPKDLPTFDGNPEDWPLFLSSFRHSTEVAGFSNVENLMRLQSSLRGKAKELVRSKLMLPAMVGEIMQTLEMCYGRPEHILESLIEKARKFPAPKDKLENFIEYALMVRNLCATMEACSMNSHLHNPMLVKELVDKLPNTHKLNWAMHTKDPNIPVIKGFSDWIYNIAIAASQVVSPIQKRSASINTHSAETTKPQQTPRACALCGDDSHKIQNCDEFRDASLSEKWDIVKTKRLCRQCLNSHRRKCNINKVCGINNCTAKHHQLMHNNASNENEQLVNEVTMNAHFNAVNAHDHGREDEKPLFRFIPVRLYSKSKILETFAFLDEGSSVTLLEEDIFENLSLEGVSEPLTLKWTGNTTRDEEGSVKLSVSISGIESGSKKFVLNDVHTVKQLGLPMQSLNFKRIIRCNSYLNGLPIKSYKNIVPKILIGVNNWKLAVPLKIREGNWNQPIASKTRLGWTLQGPSSQSSIAHYANVHTCDCEKEYNELHEQVKNYFSMEDSPKNKIFSSDDHKVMKVLNDTCQIKEGQYEIGLLWKNRNVQLPDSYNSALHRMKCLQKKFRKDKGLQNILQNEIDKLVNKNYARKLTSSEIESTASPVWYLPIFIALNPNKPGKIRMVWDAASKANGLSLNDFLMTGPDLLRPLFDILVEFRVGKIAICGDISEMFHRINVRKEDMHVQRFLWFGENERVPSVYVMRALTFGISCAPCIAHFVRNKNAEMFAAKYPRAVKAIQYHHYMDDFIDSVNTDEEAIQLATEVINIHAAAGFKMHNWSTNSAGLRKYLCGDKNGDQFSHELGPIEKILGMYWDPNNDVFRYNCRFARLRRDVFSDQIIPTKREVLQVLMAIFDPLGFLAIHTIGLKILLQEIWRSQIEWDQELSADLSRKWRKWTSTLHDISNITIQRCYSPLLATTTDVELHTFVDAGEFAYAAVCFLRVQYESEVNTSIIAAKCKVAPLKPVSIPRMELQAAVTGVKLATKILNCSRVKFEKCFWWTDSKTVLNWLSMDPRNFKPFVMHRVGEILENTNLSQWKWVPSKSNPADAATKVSKPNIDQWFNGPDFLKYPADTWPICSNVKSSSDEIELRHPVFHVQIEKQIFNFKYFSSWRRLYRALATFILYTERLRAISLKNPQPNEVTFEMIEKSKIILYKLTQRSEFTEEISDLNNNKTVSKNSKLKQLNPYVDNAGIIRAEGRIQSLNCNRPIILPQRHHITFLIVKYYHEEYHHCFHEAIINNIRSRFYIPRLRVIYKSVRGECQRCKNNFTSPQIPQMAPLPSVRLASFERPFTYVGIDFFGPYMVIVGRHKEKRWGVVFTCLTVRAIHVEVAHSLDTSSCIMCISNFISRRGMPKEIFTDNGTNFKATARVLKEEQQTLNLHQLISKFDEIKWSFNPPAAPHMGGAWERMVKSVKTVLKNAFPIFKFNDESFRNALCEAEFIINSRPLTFVSLDADDDEPLTPNHLLLGSSSGYKPICSNNDLRERWRQTQKFADYFWKRWVREYAPNLLRRVKWYNKQPPASVGDVVILVDENLPRNTWPKGVIIETTTASDGQVRRAKVKTSTSILERPISKIAVLDVRSKMSEGKLITT